MARPDMVFEDAFDKLLQQRKQFLGDVDALVMFTLVGDGGGIWTLDMRKGGTAHAYRGKVENPDIHIMMEATFLDKFITGEIKAEDIVESRVGMIADERKMKALMNFLNFETNPLGVRAMQAR